MKFGAGIQLHLEDKYNGGGDVFLFSITGGTGQQKNTRTGVTSCEGDISSEND